MSGGYRIPNAVKDDFREINHLADILADLVEDKRCKAVIRKIKNITEGYHE